MDKQPFNTDDLKTSYFTFGDIIVLGLILATGIYFIITSAIKVGMLFFGNIDEFDVLIGMIGVVVGYGLIFGAYKFIKRSGNLKAIADGLFVETIYERLEPLLSDIAETKTSYDLLNDRIDNLNYNVDDIRKSIELGKNVPSSDIPQIQNAIKNITNQFQTIMLTTITLGLYMFMYYNPEGLVPYMGPIVFILWWALMTSHHDLWEVEKAWYWAAVPILIIPIYTILIAALFTTNLMLSVMFIGLGIYVFLYYIWCEKKERGILPFGIGARIHNIKIMMDTKAKLQKNKTLSEKSEVSKPALKPKYIGSILIILAILVFAFMTLVYLIENKLIDISWDTLGLTISWDPLYFYGLAALGLLLLVIGSIFVIKLRKFK